MTQPASDLLRADRRYLIHPLRHLVITADEIDRLVSAAHDAALAVAALLC